MTEADQAAFEQVKESLKESCKAILTELDGRETKAGAKRVRKETLEIQRIGKEYRKMSVDLL